MQEQTLAVHQRPQEPGAREQAARSREQEAAEGMAQGERAPRSPAERMVMVRGAPCRYCAAGAGVPAVAVPAGLVPGGAAPAGDVAASAVCGSGGAGGSEGEK